MAAQGPRAARADPGPVRLHGSRARTTATCSPRASTSASSRARPASITSTRRRRWRPARTCWCEKPVTIAPADAWDLVETAVRLDRHLVSPSAGTTCRCCAGASDLMDRHGIGEVEHVIDPHGVLHPRAALEHRRLPASRARARCRSRRPGPTRRLSGGGYGQAQLCHALGLALWLTGLRGERAFALDGRTRSTRRSSCTTRSRCATRAARSARCRAPPRTRRRRQQARARYARDRRATASPASTSSASAIWLYGRDGAE